LLHSLTLVGAIAALHTSSQSLGIFVTVVATPVICQDYQVGDKIVARCNDGQSLAAPVGGVLFGTESYIPGVNSVVNATQAPAPVALGTHQ
jgi:hypothetical protein